MEVANVNCTLTSHPASWSRHRSALSFRFGLLSHQIIPCRRHASIICSAENKKDEIAEAGTEDAVTSTSERSGQFGSWAAGGAVGLGIAFFLASRLSTGPVTLSTLERASVPLDEALQNNRPTLVEFYAGWCEVCRELAPRVYEVEKDFKDNVNFVMLNIENPKWAPEIAEFGVGGVPHFVFLDRYGKSQAAAVGRLPKQVLEGNVSALSQGFQLPYRGAKGPTSSLPSSTSAPVLSSPRSHG